MAKGGADGGAEGAEGAAPSPKVPTGRARWVKRGSAKWNEIIGVTSAAGGGDPPEGGGEAGAKAGGGMEAGGGGPGDKMAKVVTTMHGNAKRKAVLDKPPEMRDLDDLYLLEEMILGVKFLSNLPVERRLEVCRVLHYESQPEGHTVCQQGDVGTSFYIVLTGKVSILIKQQEAAGSGDEEEEEDVEVGQLSAGDSFGELALMEEGSTRAATIKTVMPTEFLVVTKEDYDRILKSLKSDELEEKVEFLKNVHLFRDVGDKELQSIAYVLHSKTYQRGQVIVKQNDESDDMFFVKNGECRVVIALDVPELDRPRSRLGDRSQSAFPASRPGSRPGSRPSSRASNVGSRPQTAEGRRGGAGRPLSAPIRDRNGRVPLYEKPETRMERTFLEIATLGDFTCFGEVGVILRKPRTASVISNSQVELMVLNKWDVYKRLGDEILEAIEDQIREYATEDEIRKEYMTTIRWETYKRTLLEQMLRNPKVWEEKKVIQTKPFKV